MNVADFSAALEAARQQPFPAVCQRIFAGREAGRQLLENVPAAQLIRPPSPFASFITLPFFGGIPVQIEPNVEPTAVFGLWSDGSIRRIA